MYPFELTLVITVRIARHFGGAAAERRKGYPSVENKSRKRNDAAQVDGDVVRRKRDAKTSDLCNGTRDCGMNMNNIVTCLESS